MATATKSSGYLPTLDGWRALAILLVLASHDRVRHIGGHALTWFEPRGGRYGVGLFFALSGLLITSRLLQEEAFRKRIDLRGFYIRRVCRIQPASTVYLAVVGIMALAGTISYRNGVLSALLFARNYLPLHADRDAWYTAHFWSLAIEEHYYFFVPALLVLVKRWRALLFSTLLVILYALKTQVGTPRLPNFQTDLEGTAILLGALAAILLVRAQVRAWCVRFLQPVIVLPLVLAFWIRMGVHFSRFDPEMADVSMVLLLVSTMLHPATLAGRVLESAPLKFLGRISYSLYLWQQMFFPFIERFSPAPHDNLLFAIQHSAWRYLALPAVATASYFFVEKPLIRVGHRLARPATPGRDDLDELPGGGTAALAGERL